MKGTPEIFIHIGAYKTGTTFLQTRIFPVWPNLVYRNDLWLPYLALVEKDKKYLLSNETLYGRPWARNNQLSWSQERKAALRALGRLFPHAQILVSVRGHSYFLLSLYKQYLHEGGVVELDDFFDISSDSGLIKKDDLMYMQTINWLRQYFKTDPFVFTFEEMRDNLAGLLKRFETLFKEVMPGTASIERAPKNQGVFHWQSRLLRLLNRIDRKPWSYIKTGGVLKLTNPFTLAHGLDPRTICQKRLKWVSNKPIQFNDDYKRRIDEFYEEDWKAIKRLIP